MVILFKFHSNVFFKRSKVKFFPSFFTEILLYWKKHLTRKLEIPSCISSQYLWHNENIQVDKNSVDLVWFSEKNMSLKFFSQMAPLEHKINLRQNTNCMKIITFNGCDIPEGWKYIIKKTHANIINLTIHVYHVIKGSRILALDKLISTEIYS